MNDKTIAKVCLPKRNTMLIDNIELIAVGWGTTYESSEHASDSLHQVTLTAINSSSSLCTSIAHDMTTQLCAGTIPYSGKGE
ncbi:unnamed protein product [Adineta steineri]|uniref:Peptidase S1 domain-containing protein n=1 Tax=Adineta steineri TaxID=433720 RepID=A0A813URX6_9BILA|nr:unnamed protein product [Adineta steineri]